MILLSIETTGSEFGLSVFRVDKLKNSFGIKHLRSFSSPENRRASDDLIPTLDSLLRRQKIKKTEIKLVGVDSGPGSFTGVRVGVAVARVLGEHLPCPVIGISSLQVVAAKAVKTMGVAKAEVVVAWLPALENECYMAAYKTSVAGELSCVFDPTWLSKIEFEKKLQGLRKKFKKITTVTGVPDSRTVGELAFSRWLASLPKQSFPFDKVVPIYLQPSWAERKS